tara:strand:+ start:12545 stop:13321 length:777 start_codon:yes stop_codon:yes gene_type:complete
MEDEILIDNYLKGLLTKNEEKSFLERLDSDTEFKENFKLEEELFNALDENSWSAIEGSKAEVEDYKNFLQEDDLQNLKKTLIKTNSEFNTKVTGNKYHLFYYLAAASIVALLGFQFFFNQMVSNQELYNEFVALNDLPSFVSRSDEVTQLTEAQQLFEEKNYKKALEVFNSFKEQDGALAIYKGIAQAELGNYNEAEKTFNTLINSNLLDAEKGYWYKALIFLKADRKLETIAVLETIISKNLYKNNEAKILLEKIKN